MTGKELSGPLKVEEHAADNHAPQDTAPHRKYVTADGVPTDIHPVTFQVAEASVGSVQSYVRNHLHPQNRAVSHEDVAQEALLGLMESYQNGPPPVADTCIAYGVARNKIRGYWYALDRQKENEKITHTVPEQTDPNAHNHNPLDPRLLAQIRGLLGEKYAKLFDLVLENPDLRGAERASRLGIPPNTERSQLQRMRGLLHKRGIRLHGILKPPA